MSFDEAPIYMERQEPGSLLCANHCLNNLLQESLFSASELANIGHRLDELESAQLEGPAGQSHNVDDSGFFSVGVLEEALKTHQLRLVRWHSEELKPMHAYPSEIPAYIFNLEQHWFTIRRFADNADLFFNLNSFQAKPEHVSQMYLGMLLEQSQREGYSVFAVLSENFNGSLQPCEADAYFEKHSHLALQGPTPQNGRHAVASSSRSLNRPRPSDFDLEDSDSPPAQRMRFTPPGEDEGVSAATTALRGSTLDDEEEALRRAIEASLQDAGMPVVDTEVQVPKQPAWSVPRGPEAMPPAPPPVDDQTPPNETPEEDDSPTIEELRRRRLARFA